MEGGIRPTHLKMFKASAKASSNSQSKPKLHGVWPYAIDDHVIAVSWSRRSDKVAVAAVSGPITLLNGETGKLLHTLKGHGLGTTSIDFHPTGELLASGGQDGSVRLWNVATGAEQVAMSAGSDWVESLAWSRDGSTLAVAAGKRIRFFDAHGELLCETPDHSSTVADIRWQPTDDLLAVASYGGVSLWRPGDPKPLKQIEFKGSLLRLAWRPDGRFLVAGTQEASVRYYEVQGKGAPLQMSGFATKVRELSWHHQSRWLAIGGGPMICVWDCSGKGPKNRQPLMLEVNNGEENVTAVDFQHNGSLLAAGNQAGLMTVWQADKFEKPVGWFEAPAEISVLSWSPNDQILLAGCANGIVATFTLD